MGNFGQNEYSFCAQGLNLGGYDSGFSNFSKKKWVKMVKLFDFYGRFEKGLMGSLWVDLGHR